MLAMVLLRSWKPLSMVVDFLKASCSELTVIHRTRIPRPKISNNSIKLQFGSGILIASCSTYLNPTRSYNYNYVNFVLNLMSALSLVKEYIGSTNKIIKVSIKIIFVK